MLYMHPLKIGNIKLSNNILLAPMAGITDKPFRILCEEKSIPGLVFTEMVSSKAIYYKDEKTSKLANTENEKVPVAIQIFGSEPEIMAHAAKELEPKANIIDINMGCPAPKVVKNGDGSKLLQNLDLVFEIVKKVVSEVKVPVTVKIRKGWDNNNIVAIEAAKVIEKAGASAITIHGRTSEEYYSGNVDLDIIKKVKEAVDIPVIGNGDVKNVQSAQKMFEYTNVDGIMVGRATLGNPWLINQIKKGLDGIEVLDPTFEEKFDTIKKHIDLEIAEKGENVGIKEMRKHISWYIKNLKDSSKMRDKINTLETKQEVVECLNEYFKILQI